MLLVCKVYCWVDELLVLIKIVCISALLLLVSISISLVVYKITGIYGNSRGNHTGVGWLLATSYKQKHSNLCSVPVFHSFRRCSFLRIGSDALHTENGNDPIDAVDHLDQFSTEYAS